MKKTRKEYEGNKEFDFVFITEQRSSPEKRYDNFVKQQELKNTYRLSTDDYNYLRQLFKSVIGWATKPSMLLFLLKIYFF